MSHSPATLARIALAAAIGARLLAGGTEAFGQLVESGEVIQPPGVEAPEPLPPASAPLTTIDDLVHLAVANNPAVAQAAARVQALRGKWVQAGLPPNPTAGYVASEVGNDRRGGQQGGFAGQEFVTAGKLQLDQAVVCREIQQAEQQLLAVQTRVATDVRRSGYAVLIAQRRVEIAQRLLQVSAQAVEVAKGLERSQETTMAPVLQSEVEYQNAALQLQNAANDEQLAWRQLAAVIGASISPQPISGDVTQLPETLDWDQELARVTAESPELGAALTEILRARSALRRAEAEPIPNVTTQLSVQYDDATNDTIVGAQVGVPLPLWNRNQGGIQQAYAEVAQAGRNADRIRRDLQWRLAEAFKRYQTARIQAETYATAILPKAQQSYELVQRGYPEEVGYLDLLTAQRTYSQTNLAYLDALAVLWAAKTEIDGLLLTGSLAQPPN